MYLRRQVSFMDDLVNQVMSRTGLSQEQAQQAVDAVLSFVKEKLPEPLASQLDGLLSGDSGAAGLMEQLGSLGGLGNLFGKQ